MAIMLKPKSHHGKLNRKKEEIRHSLHVFGVFFDLHTACHTQHTTFHRVAMKSLMKIK